MSRFTGSSWKVSRRLGYSISETEKETRTAYEVSVINLCKIQEEQEEQETETPEREHEDTVKAES